MGGVGLDELDQRRVRARVVLHVGLPKTGTTYLQALLADHRDVLRSQGVLYPFLRPGGMFHAAVEVRGSHEKFGLDPDLVQGSWAALCERARQHDGVSVISHEVLGGATEAEIAAALALLDGLEVHVVVTARDLARQATAHWQEEVKLGDPRSFADFEREQFRADRPDDRPHFWHAQDYAAALARWSTAVGPERAHLVVCPRAGAPAGELWRRFAAAAGIAPAVVDGSQVPPSQANASLGRVEIAVLRAVNAELDGALPQPGYSRVVKRQLAEGLLARQDGELPRTPADLVDLFAVAALRWRAAVEAAGHPVHGSLDELTPLPPPDGAPHPDDARVADRLEVATEALAGLVLAAASPPPATPGATRTPAPARRRLLRRRGR
jgi:hypothetical protein